MTCRFACCLLAVAALAAAETNAWNGPNRDGAFSGKGLVTTCHYDPRDPKANENIVWATELPFWGMNSPVYGHGQIYVLCDPGFEHDAPQLVAVDAASGEIRWQDSVDNLDGRSDADVAWARKERARELELTRQGRRFAWRWNTAKDEAARAAIQAEIEKVGFGFEAGKDKGKPRAKVSHCSSRFHGQLAHPKELATDYKRLSNNGFFWWEGWHYLYNRYTGQTMPSVVTDEAHVYVYTNLDAAACFTKDGKRRWITALGMKGWGHGGGPITTASPTLVDDLLICNRYDLTVALKRDTGAIVWRHEQTATGGYQAGSEAKVLTVDGTHYLYVGDNGAILRAADGQVVGRLMHPNEKRQNPNQYFAAHTPSVARDNLIWVSQGGYGGGGHANGNGLFAYRLSAEGDGIAAELLWQKPCRGTPRIALDGDILIVVGIGNGRRGSGMSRIDAVTGEVLVETKGNLGNAVSLTLADSLLIDQTRIWYHKRVRGTPKYRPGFRLLLMDAATLKPRSDFRNGNHIYQHDPEGRWLDKRIAARASSWWQQQDGQPTPTVWGKRIFVRNWDMLYCIGKP